MMAQFMMVDGNQQAAHGVDGVPRIVIVGAGFGGLRAAKTLAAAAPEAHITLLDRFNYHTFTPLLYQVATAALGADEIARSVRSILRKRANVAFRVAEVTGVDLDARLVHTTDGDLPYDFLILAAGSTTRFFGTPGAAEHTYGLKDVPEALDLRNQLLLLIERAAAEPDADRRRALLTIAIVGGGPTGVELAGAIAELTRMTVQRDYPMLDPNEIRVLLIEAGSALLGAFRPRLRAAALEYFRRHGVEVLLNTVVEEVSEKGVTVRGGATIPTPTVIWAAGVQAQRLTSAEDATQRPDGRLAVNEFLQLPDHPEVYAIGDMAAATQGGAPLPMLAPVALQEGQSVGRNLARRLHGEPQAPFHYVDRGIMATLGRSHAVAQTGPVTLTGFVAWVAWLALHLVELIGFRNRALVLVNWIWDYVFFQHGSRIILWRYRHESAPYLR
jgi:NADH dehydrogenase